MILLFHCWSALLSELIPLIYIACTIVLLFENLQLSKMKRKK